MDRNSLVIVTDGHTPQVYCFEKRIFKHLCDKTHLIVADKRVEKCPLCNSKCYRIELRALGADDLVKIKVEY